MSDMANRLEEIFSDLMPEESVPVRQRTKINCATWDSLFQLHVILAIEQEFQITISDDEAGDLNSFDSALQILEDRFSSQEK